MHKFFEKYKPVAFKYLIILLSQYMLFNILI